MQQNNSSLDSLLGKSTLSSELRSWSNCAPIRAFALLLFEWMFEKTARKVCEQVTIVAKLHPIIVGYRIQAVQHIEKKIPIGSTLRSMRNERAIILAEGSIILYIFEITLNKSG